MSSLVIIPVNWLQLNESFVYTPLFRHVYCHGLSICTIGAQAVTHCLCGVEEELPSTEDVI